MNTVTDANSQNENQTLEKKLLNYKVIITSAIISSLFTVIGSLFIYYLTIREPALQYEILPISYFKKDSFQLSIANIKILNNGKRECDDVSLSINFGSNITANDFSFQKSSESITIKQNFDSATGRLFYSIPYLNPKEQIIYSFLINKAIDEKNIQVDLRSKGLTGERLQLQRSDSEISSILFLATLGMFITAIGIVIFVIFNQRKVIRYQLNQYKLLQTKFKNLEDSKIKLTNTN